MTIDHPWIRRMSHARLSLPSTLFLFALVVGAGCKAEDVTTSTNAPSGWTVTLGSSGGFTGGGSGYQILADGKVSSWTRLTPKADVTTTSIGSASDQTLEALYAAVTAPELQDVQLSQTGNMTSFLEWKRGDETRRYSWPEGASLPDPVARAQAAALAAVQDARSHQ